MRKLSLFFFVVAFSAVISLAQTPTQGTFYGTSKGAGLTELPLVSTKVRADISGFVARVTVTQEFQNNLAEPADAVYNFPLSQNSAVDEMTMTIGERTIRGKILRRAEAQKVFEQAKTDGKAAALLDQQRPNIFTQSVANIDPGSKIVVVISYVEILKFENGEFEFVFPMTIGPRYTPAASNDPAPVIPKAAETRNGSDISIEVNLEAGLPVESLYSNSHQIEASRADANTAKITLRDEKTIPNKDFVLRYDVTGKRIADSLLATRPEKDGFFSLVLAPPDITADTDFTPKEIVFVLDTSGSMSGFPIEKAKEAIRLSLDGLNPDDTFNIITFAGDTSILFPEPVKANSKNLETARSFLGERRGGGGTEMMKAIRAALVPTESKSRLRIVCFMTDGFVTNEAEILGEIKNYPKARIFSFGIGTTVNRYLLDKMAELGNGEVEYVGPQDDGSAAARRFYERVRTPVLTDISIDWNGLPVSDIYPKKLGDLFSAKPVILTGRYASPARGVVTLHGNIGGQTFSRKIEVALPEREPANGALATLWARRRVDSLRTELYGIQDKVKREQLEEQITALALEFRLMTEFTSFVAVEETMVDQNGRRVRVETPLNTGSADTPFRRMEIIASLQRPPQVNYESTVLLNGASQNRGGLMSPTATVDVVSDAQVVVRPDSTDSLYTSAPSAFAILKRIDDHQKALKTLKSDVRITNTNSALNISDVSEGKLQFVSETGALRVDITKPNTEILTVAKGRTLLYRPSTNSALIGTLPAKLVAAMSFFQNGLVRGGLTNAYDVALRGFENLSENEQAARLTLTPKNSGTISSVDLWVDASGVIRRITILKPNGDSTVIDLLNLSKNAAVDPDFQKVSLPKDTKVIKN